MKTVAVPGASADRAKFGNEAMRAHAQRGFTFFAVFQTLATALIACLSSGCAGGGSFKPPANVSGPTGVAAFAVAGSGDMSFTISHYRDGKPVQVGRCHPEKELLNVPLPVGVHEFAVIPVKEFGSKLVNVRVAEGQTSIAVITSNTARGIASRGEAIGYVWYVTPFPPGVRPPLK